MATTAELQMQIVELRMRIDQQGEAQAALLQHTARREVLHALGRQALTDDELSFIREECKARARKKQMIHDIMVHLAKWGAGGAVGFIAFSLWESFKGEVRK